MSASRDSRGARTKPSGTKPCGTKPGGRSLLDLLAEVVDDVEVVWPAEVVGAAETILDRLDHARMCAVCQLHRLDDWLLGQARRALLAGPEAGGLDVVVELAGEVERRPRRCTA